MFEPKDYTVIKIEGVYATLQDDITGDTLFIAMDLLPERTDVGKHLHFENLEYTIMN